jgi:hypothetical protein
MPNFNNIDNNENVANTLNELLGTKTSNTEHTKDAE